MELWSAHLAFTQEIAGSNPAACTMSRRVPLEVKEKLKHSPSENATIVELRTKLEIRTWFLRASLALNIGLISGLVVHMLTRN